MASAVLVIAAAILVLALAAPATLAQPVAPAPAPAGPLNLTAILVKGGQYTSFIRLLQDTRVDTQINSQLNNSFNGLTVFAPTDNAFQNLKPGTINGLSTQDQVQLVLYHVLPRYYTLATFQTASNPINTQAAGSEGVYTLNVTTTPNEANVTTGVVVTQLNTPLYSTFPLAVYSVDKVLLPYELFGAKPPAAAPTPSAAKPGGKSPGSSGSAGAAAPGADAAGNSSGAAGLKGYWSLAVGAGVVGVLGSTLFL